ncbi:MAG: hypothetical protein INQ03_00555 [Candidatus Heimdallarchaeota archaeon]|nr:hypothetical protein [Candidatus Heimdallarchaeota archaeon]
MSERKSIMDACEWFFTHHGSKTMKTQLTELVVYLGDEKEDIYGNGMYLQQFEQQLAELFGKDSALFFISGTMAQQIALRIHCEHRGNFKVAFHPECHLSMAEFMGYEELHGIKRVQFGAPERLYDRLVTLQDFKGIKEEIAAIVIELPQRHLAQLHTWDELVSISEWAREKNIALHLDGARIWECMHFYGKSLAEIANLFDTVYISFYKGLNNMTGAALLGPKVFSEEAKVWQRRHGGNLKTQFPYVVSAKKSIEENLPKINGYVEYTIQIADILHKMEHFIVTPYPVQTNMFNLILKGSSMEVNKVILEFAKEHKQWLFMVGDSFMTGYCQTEITIGDNAMKKSIEDIQSIFDQFHRMLYP